MSEWEAVRLAGIVEVLDRFRRPVSSTERAARSGDVPYYGANGRTGWIDDSLFNEDLVLLGEDAIDFLNPSARKAYVITGASWVNNHVHVLRAQAAWIQTGFLAHALNCVDYSPHVQTGGTRSKLTQAKMNEIEIPLPPLTEQRRIVDVMAAVDAQIEALTAEVERAGSTYRNALSLLWLDSDGREGTVRPLGDVMVLDVERCSLTSDAVYFSAGVLGSGRGLVDKGSFRGNETEYSAMNTLRTNQVVMRKLTAWEGPITVVPPAFDGFVASSEFPTFTLSPEANPDWMRHVCRTTRLWEEMRNRVTGTVQRRKRLSPEQLLDVALPIPSGACQRQAASALDMLDNQCERGRAELAHLRAFRSALLTSLLNQDIAIPESYDALLTADMKVAS